MRSDSLSPVSRAHEFLANSFLKLAPRALGYHLLRKLIVLAFLSTLLFVPAGHAQSTLNQPSKSVIEALLLKSFGPEVEAVTSFTPYQLTGDFNGDGALDTLIIVRVKSRSRLLKDVMLVNPFYGGRVPSKELGLAIAIIHGATKLKPDSAAGKFLLIGESPVLILENSRAISAEPNDRKDLMELVKKKGKRSRTAMRPPAIAKGDSVSLPTEAADSILYWNGKKYRWEESAGGE